MRSRYIRERYGCNDHALSVSDFESFIINWVTIRHPFANDLLCGLYCVGDRVFHRCAIYADVINVELERRANVEIVLWHV